MKFVTKSTDETIASLTHLLELINHALCEKTPFAVGECSKRCLQLAAYSDEGELLELHRGKKWEGWISPQITNLEEIREIFTEYYERGDLSDKRLKAHPEWMEVAGFHPAVYVVAGILLVGVVVYFTYIK